jgi:hypothetical protein
MRPIVAKIRSTPSGTAIPAAIVVIFVEWAPADAVTVTVVVTFEEETIVDGGSFEPFARL